MFLIEHRAVCPMLASCGKMTDGQARRYLTTWRCIKMENADFLLSGGVIAALIAGVFSIVGTIINTIRISKMEHERERFKLDESKLALFQEAYRRYWQIESPLAMLSEMSSRNMADGAVFQNRVNDCEKSCKAYFELVQSLKPYCDEDLYSEWLLKVEAHDAAVARGRTEIREHGSTPPEEIVAANLDLEEACEKVISEQIKRLINRE